MRLGLIADIHANLDALTAVLAEMERAQVDLIVCAGDLVCYGAFPNECLDLLRARGIPSVAGNYDDAVAWGRASASRARSSPATEPLKLAALRWAQDELSAYHRPFLRGLPWSIEYHIAGLHVHVLHAGQQYLDEWLSPEQPEQLAALAGSVHADLIVLGHTHQQFAWRSGATMLVNPGAVGRSLDGDPRAACAVWDTQTREATLLRVEYDVDAAASAIEHSGMPAEIGMLVRLGARRIEELVIR